MKKSFSLVEALCLLAVLQIKKLILPSSLCVHDSNRLYNEFH